MKRAMLSNEHASFGKEPSHLRDAKASAHGDATVIQGHYPFRDWSKVPSAS